MTTRTIKVLANGQTFSGSPTEILKEMQYLAFGWEDKPLDDYTVWLKGQMERQVNTPMDAGSHAQLVDCMVKHGLALEVL